MDKAVVIDIWFVHQHITDGILPMKPACTIMCIIIKSFTFETVDAGFPAVLETVYVGLEHASWDICILRQICCSCDK